MLKIYGVMVGYPWSPVNGGARGPDWCKPFLMCLPRVPSPPFGSGPCCDRGCCNATLVVLASTTRAPRKLCGGGLRHTVLYQLWSHRVMFCIASAVLWSVGRAVFIAITYITNNSSNPRAVRCVIWCIFTLPAVDLYGSTTPLPDSTVLTPGGISEKG